MENQYKVVEEQNQIVFEDGEKNKLAFVTIVETSEGYELVKTYVSDVLRGQGIAGKLMELFYKKCKRDHKRAIPVCSYAVKWFEKNVDKRDVLL